VPDERTWNELIALRASVEGKIDALAAELRADREAQREREIAMRADCRACSDSTTSQIRRLSHRADTSDRRMVRHLQDHGLDPEDVSQPLSEPRTSTWVAPTAQHLYEARWRILGGVIVLVGVSLPQAWPYLRGLLGVIR
jgi:hypothetical protein